MSGFLLIGWPHGVDDDVLRSTWVEGRRPIGTLAEATERAQEWTGFHDDAVVQVVEARRPCPVVRTVHGDGHADVGPPPTQQGDFYRWLAWWKQRGA